MKKSFLGFFIAVFFISCKKNDSDVKTVALHASKIVSIKAGEEVVFALSGTTENNVNWSVTPSTNVIINSSSDYSWIKYMRFGYSGNYHVVASEGNKTSSLDISVDSIRYEDGATILPLTGDQINITLSKTDSAGIPILNFTARTKNHYNCLNSFLISDLTVKPQYYQISYNNVAIPSDAICIPGQSNADGSDIIYPIEDGSHEFKVVFNGKTYSGSFVKTGNAFTFTWPYSSGVTISPLTL